MIRRTRRHLRYLIAFVSRDQTPKRPRYFPTMEAEERDSSNKISRPGRSTRTKDISNRNGVWKTIAASSIRTMGVDRII